jgi:hypothetical protein
MSKNILNKDYGFSPSDFSFLILSCDKFSDMWEPFRFSFHKYWKDCPFQANLLSNLINFQDSVISNMKVGEDISWSANLIFALENTPQKFVILWLDDVFFKDKVPTLELLDDLKWFYENDIDYLRLRSTEIRLFNVAQGYEKLSVNDPYRTSIFATVWNKSVLQDILVKEENAWQFEFRGSIRSKIYNKFYSLKKSRFKYIHAVEKGVWIRSAVKWAKNNNLSLDLNYRNQISIFKNILIEISRVKGYFINTLPVDFRSKVLKIAQKVYVTFGLRGKDYYSNK